MLYNFFNFSARNLPARYSQPPASPGSRSRLHLASWVLQSCVLGLLLGLAAAAEEKPGATSAPAAPAAPLPELTREALDSAIRRGVDFLLADQHKNGSWGDATQTKDLNIFAPLPGGHQAFRAGASGLALAGLIDSADPRPEVAAAIERAAAWTAAELPNLRRTSQDCTYNCWGHAYGLRAISRLYQREPDPAKKAAWVRLAQQQVDRVNRSEDVYGGWGYLDIFDGLTTQKPSGLPTSFTTATVLLAMAEARSVMGVTLDDKLVKHALAGINSQRTPDFSYTYSFQHRSRASTSTAPPARSAARRPATPACACSATRW